VPASAAPVPVGFIAESVMEVAIGEDMVMLSVDMVILPVDMVMLLELLELPPPPMGPPAAGVAAAAVVVVLAADDIIIGALEAAVDIEGVTPPVLAKRTGLVVNHIVTFPLMTMALKTPDHGCGYPPSDQVKDMGKFFGAAELCPRVFEAGLISPQVVKGA